MQKLNTDLHVNGNVLLAFSSYENSLSPDHYYAKMAPLGFYSHCFEINILAAL